MLTNCSFDPAAEAWRIRVAEAFDVDEAKACIKHFCGYSTGRLRRLVFDLTGTRRLHTAGLGTMLFIRSCCEIADADAQIVYNDPQVGMVLRLANMDRWFTLIPEGAALKGEKVPARQHEGTSHAS